MPSKAYITMAVACLIILSLNVNLAYSLDFGKHFDNSEMPRDKFRYSFDELKLQFKEMRKKMMEGAGEKFVIKSPDFKDYSYLAYDVVIPIGSYLGYFGEKPLTREELCKQLIGAGTAFVGSVGGASVGSFVGTLICPGGGTALGGSVGGDHGYTYGKKLGIEVIGEMIC